MRGLFWLFFLLPIFGIGQNIHFIKSYGNSGYDYGRDIKQTPDTGYIATGSSSSFTSGNADAFLLKVDSLGNFEWSYNYGGSNSDWGMELVITHDSSYAIAGYTNSFGAGGFDFYAVRANQFGEPIWEKTYGGSDWDKAYGIAQVNQDSGFVIVGETFSFGNGNRDIYIVRVDQNGDTIWTKTYGGLEDDWASGVLIDGDSIVVCGGTESFGAGMSDGIILKMDLDGNLGWEKIEGKYQEDYFTSIIKHLDYYCLSGSKSYTYVTDLNDFWVYKIHMDGSVVLADTTWDGDQFGRDIAYDVVVEPITEVVYYGGSTTSWGTADIINGVTDCFISKLTAGNSWMPYVQNFGDLGSDVLFAMDYCYDEGIIATGDMEKYSTGGNNMLIVKIDKANSFGYITVYEDVIFENITLSIQNEPSIELKIFPNPANGYILVDGNFDNYEFQILTLDGKIITQGTSQKNQQIDISYLSEATYIFSIITQDGVSNSLIVVGR